MNPEDRDILVIDMETTGFKAGWNDAIQVAGVLLRGSDLAELAAYTALMRPLRPEAASPEALAIHGYSLDHLAACAHPRDVYRGLYAITKLGGHPPQLAAHNADFDMEFLAAAEREFGFTLPRADVEPFCTMVAARIYLEARGKTANAKLGTIAEHYGITFQAHDALGDVRATAAILRRMREEAPALYRRGRDGTMIKALLDDAGDSLAARTARAEYQAKGKLWPKQFRALVEAADRLAGAPA